VASVQVWRHDNFPFTTLADDKIIKVTIASLNNTLKTNSNISDKIYYHCGHSLGDALIPGCGLEDGGNIVVAQTPAAVHPLHD
jgi:hypothetical protein